MKAFLAVVAISLALACLAGSPAAPSFASSASVESASHDDGFSFLPAGPAAGTQLARTAEAQSPHAARAVVMRRSETLSKAGHRRASRRPARLPVLRI